MITDRNIFVCTSTRFLRFWSVISDSVDIVLKKLRRKKSRAYEKIMLGFYLYISRNPSVWIRFYSIINILCSFSIHRGMFYSYSNSFRQWVNAPVCIVFVIAFDWCCYLFTNICVYFVQISIWLVAAGWIKNNERRKVSHRCSVIDHFCRVF